MAVLSQSASSSQFGHSLTCAPRQGMWAQPQCQQCWLSHSLVCPQEWWLIFPTYGVMAGNGISFPSAFITSSCRVRLLSFICCSCQQEKLVLSQMINNVCCGEGVPRCDCGNTHLPLTAFCLGLVLQGPAQTAVGRMCQLLVSG